MDVPAVGSSAPRRGYHDVWFAVLFLLNAIGVIVIAVLCFLSNDFSEHKRKQSHAIVAMGSATIPTAIVCAFVWLWLMNKFATEIILFALCLGVLVNVIAAIVLLAAAQMIGILFVIFAVIGIIYIFFVRNRIAFSSLLLAKSAAIMAQHASVVAVVLFAQFVVIVWVIVWAMAAVGTHLSGKSYAILWVFLIFNLFWAIEVTRNVCHVIVGGVVATAYFQGDSAPPNVVGESVKRALTTSFGSVCFGSLVLAVMSLIRLFVSAAKQEARKRNNMLIAFVMCCVDCLLSILEDALRFISKYAFVHVAIYNKPFITAARDTYELLHSHGLDLLINDNLIGGVIGVAAFLSGTVNAVIWGAIAAAVLDSKNDWLIVAVIAFFFGFGVTHTVVSAIDSCVAALFVCFAEQPDILAHTDQIFYDRITQAISAKQATLTASLNTPISGVPTYS